MEAIEVDEKGITIKNVSGDTQLRIWGEEFDIIRKAMKNSEILKKEVEELSLIHI